MIMAGADAAAQNRPASAATLFQDIYGPDGLRVNSEAVLPDGSTHSAHFNSAFQSNFTLFNIALVGQLTAIPLPSPAGGFTYTFDHTTGTFVRSTRSFGPILTDRAETIGRGRFSFGFNVQQTSFDHLEGLDLSRVQAVFTHDDHQLGGGRADVVLTTNAIQASVSQFIGSVTYGVADRLDVSLAVPLVGTRLSLLSNARIIRIGTGDAVNVHFFRDADAPAGFGSERQFFAEARAAGIGDLVLRAKATVLREGHRGLAAGLDLRLPTGEEHGLLGSGGLGLKPFAAVSLSYGRVAPHVNLAYQWNGKSPLAGSIRDGMKGDLPDQFLYAAGVDIGLHERFSIVADFLGQRILDSPRLVQRTFAATGPGGSVTLPDITFEHSSFPTAGGAVGFKTKAGDAVLLNFNLRFKIGPNGLTDRVSPLIGIEYGF